MILRSSSKKLSIRTLFLLGTGGAVLLAPTFFAPRPSFADNSKSISMGWKRPANEPVSLAMSPGGKFMGSVDKDGTIQLYDENGRLVWKRRVEGATNVLIAKNGQSLLVYSQLNPIYQNVYFFRADGRLLWTHPVEGSVWAGAVSADGTLAAVTTGKHYAYIYSPDVRRPRFRRLRLDGIGYALTFSPDNRRLVIGTWQRSGLVCFDINARFQWRSWHSTELQYDMQMSLDGRSILGILPGKRSRPNVEIALWNSEGELQWTRSIEGFDGRALISPQSQYAAISYANFLPKKGAGMVERRVAVYKQNGNLLWEKGGLFFGPRLVALSPMGSSVIVSDGESSLYNIEKSGRILSRFTLGGKVQRIIASEDGHRILLYCSDGWLYLMHVG